MSLLQAGVDTSVISLWLCGHADARSTQPYVHADMAMKERALERMLPLYRPGSGASRAPDPLLSFLESLRNYAEFHANCVTALSAAVTSSSGLLPKASLCIIPVST